MDRAFIESLRVRARERRARIGIGLSNPSREIIEGLRSAKDFAELVVVTNSTSVEGFEVVESCSPEEDLIRLLRSSEIDGAVRGNVSAARTMRAISSVFDITVRRMALIEIGGWAFFLAPVGIDEGDTLEDKLDLAIDGALFIQSLGIKPKISILSGGRFEDVGRSERVDISLEHGEFIAARAREMNIDATHRGILIESARGDDMVLAPDGVSGNLLFRSLHMVCGANSMGAPIITDKIVFIDSTRARSDFVGPVILASAMVSRREDAQMDVTIN